MTFTLGTWIIPALITLAALVLAHLEARRHRGPPGPGQAVEAAIGLIAYMAAVIVALFAWFVWAAL